MDNFESQLKNAAEDKQHPPLSRHVWLGVKDQLVAQRQRQIRRKIVRWSSAAIIALAIGLTGYWFGVVSNQEQQVLKQYGLQQYDFPDQVKQKITALTGSRIPAQQVEHFNQLRSQLHFLDQQYSNYLLYIEQNGYQEYIGRQIQNYYEVKIDLLEKIQQEVEKLNNQNQNHENPDDVVWQI